MQTQWELPQAWEDFEEMCFRLAKVEGTFASLTKYGRKGQEQFGVDVVGNSANSRSHWTGIQCKLRTEHLGGKLTAAEIHSEYEKSLQFSPALTHVIFATTSPRDTRAQDAVNDHNAGAHRRHTLEIWAWEDICTKLEGNPSVARRFYPNRFRNELLSRSDDGSISTTILPRSDELNARLNAFIQDPQFRSRFGPHANHIATLLLESVDNILDTSKGMASRLSIDFDGDTLTLADNGKSFDPFDPSFSPNAYQMGVRSIRQAQLLDNIEATYVSRDFSTGQNFNELRVRLLVPFAYSETVYCTGYAEIDSLFSRRQVIDFIGTLDIHPSCDPYTLKIGGGSQGISLSALVQTMQSMRQRMGEQKLMVVVQGPNRDYLYDGLSMWKQYDPLLEVLKAEANSD